MCRTYTCSRPSLIYSTHGRLRNCPSLIYSTHGLRNRLIRARYKAAPMKILMGWLYIPIMFKLVMSVQGMGSWLINLYSSINSLNETKMVMDQNHSIHRTKYPIGYSCPCGQSSYARRRCSEFHSSQPVITNIVKTRFLFLLIWSSTLLPLKLKKYSCRHVNLWCSTLRVCYSCMRCWV